MKKIILFNLLILLVFSNVQAKNNAQSQDNIFPAKKTSYLKQTLRIDSEKLSKIDVGLNKDSVRQILGNPHFKEFGGKTWNYWLNVQIDHTHNYIECQLRLDYDNNTNLKTILWSSEECQNLSTKL